LKIALNGEKDSRGKNTISLLVQLIREDYISEVELIFFSVFRKMQWKEEKKNCPSLVFVSVK
jgi:hypothetical protein